MDAENGISGPSVWHEAELFPTNKMSFSFNSFRQTSKEHFHYETHYGNAILLSFSDSVAPFFFGIVMHIFLVDLLVFLLTRISDV